MMSLLQWLRELESAVLDGSIKSVTVVTTDSSGNGVYQTAFSTIEDASKHGGVLVVASEKMRALVSSMEGNAPPNNRSVERH